MKFVAEYIWLDGNQNLRSKSRTVNIKVTQEDLKKRDIMSEILNVNLYEEWSYDGSSTEQAKGNDSEIILKPASVITDPFRKGPNVLLLCETYYPSGVPTNNNHRLAASQIFSDNKVHEPWFGLELEFYLMQNCKHHPSRTSNNPLGWHKDNQPNPQGQYYCSVGANNAFGRKVTEQAYHLILEAGINASGMNAEVAIGQWEIQIGPCEGITAGDHFLFAKYILQRVGEIHDVQINFDPKPLSNDWNGSGCHINFSSKAMREDGGYEHILNAMKYLSANHNEHMEVYGANNHKRMTGSHETSDYNTFSWGIADRTSSVRIPRVTEKNKKGYFEDRRPASNIDPYQATSKLFQTSCNI